MATNPTKDAPSADDRANAAASYGWSLAILNSDPELKKAFNQAVKQGWSPDRFVAAIRDTKWYSKHSDTWRQSEILRITDPTTWKQQQAGQLAQVKDYAAKMGSVLTDKQAAQIAHNVTMFGWNQSQVQDALTNYVKVVNSGPLKGQYLGDAGKNAATLQALALKNGYQIPTKSLGDWNRAVLRGDRTTEDYAQFIRRQAAAAFPTFANELLAGADLDSLASPYTSSMAKLLELPESEVTLFDPTIRKALASKDVKTGKPTAMPLYDFEDSLRQDPRWMKTDNAHQEILGQGRQVLTQMGFAV